MLRHILHDWNDADALRILAALRAAIGDAPVTLCLVEVEALRLLQFHSGLTRCMRPLPKRSEGQVD